MKNSIRYIFGYLLGITIFMILIPLILWNVSSLNYGLFGVPIIPYKDISVVVSLPLFVLGAVFVIWSNSDLFFKGHGGPTDIAGLSVTPRTKQLVVDGPYKYSRNPMVFGANTIYTAITFYLNSLGGLLIVVIFFSLVVKFIIPFEEKRLINDFGEDFMQYKKRTSMIIPMPIKKQ